MIDYLQGIYEICGEFHGKDKKCDGCPFDNGWRNYGLECDSGHYDKHRSLKINEIRKIVDDFQQRKREIRGKSKIQEILNNKQDNQGG